MLNRELISWRDVWNCFVGALAITLIVCGGSYIGSGGPLPHIGVANTAMATAERPLHAAILEQKPTVQNPEVVKETAVVARSYRVRPGDTLSTIAARFYGTSKYWTSIYWANEHSIKYANVIYVGQALTIPAVPRLLAAPRTLSPVPPPQPQRYASTASVVTHPSVTSGGQSQTITVSGSAFEECVIRAESGGDPTAQNPVSTASGLFGFLDTTWYDVTGLPGPAGDYSVATQEAAFWTLYGEDGTAPWGPYDGC